MHPSTNTFRAGVCDGMEQYVGVGQARWGGRGLKNSPVYVGISKPFLVNFFLKNQPEKWNMDLPQQEKTKEQL